MAFARNVGLGQELQRRMNGERLPLDALLRPEPRGFGEAGDEFRAAIGVARIIERIDADEDIPRMARLGKGRRQREKDEIAGWYVSNRDRPLLDTRFRNVDIVGERRAPELTQIEGQHDMPSDAQPPCDITR